MSFDPGQISVMLRQGGQYAAGGISVLVLLGSIDAETSKNAVVAINEIVNGLSQATAGVSKLTVILGPTVGGILLWWAKRNSSAANKKADVAMLPNTVVVTTAPNQNAPNDVVATTALAAKIATIPEATTVLSTPEIAAATISGKVVSGASA